MNRLQIIFLGVLFSHITLSAQQINDVKRIDSLLLANDFSQVILELQSLQNNKILKENVGLHIKLLEALEANQNNEFAFENANSLLNSDVINNNQRAETHLILALLYEKTGDPEKTWAQLMKAAKFIHKDTPENVKQKWNIRMASYYRIFDKSKLDSAKYFAQNALKFNAGEIGSAYFLNSFLAEDLKSEIYYIDQAIQYYDKHNDFSTLGMMYINKGYAYFSYKQYDLYEDNLRKGLFYLKKIDNIDNNSSRYKALRKFYLHKKDYKNALVYTDSLNLTQIKTDSITNYTAIQLMSSKFQNENLISELEKSVIRIEQEELNHKNQKNKNLLLSIILVISIISIIVITSLTVLINKKRKKLYTKNIELKELADYNLLLIKETNHRVKNNLALLSGIIKISISKTNNQELIEKLIDIDNRIQSISSIHKSIYQTDDYTKINPKIIFEEIIFNQKNIINSDFEPIIESSIEEFDINISKILPFTLILNELLTNSIKHALKNPSDFIKVNFRKNLKDSTLELEVTDSGNGFELDKTTDANQSMGIYLTKILTKQLKGKLDCYKNADSFTIKLTTQI